MMLPTGNPMVIRFGRLGDTILLQPLLRRLQQRYGAPCHLLALGEWPPVLFSAQPEVGQCISLDSQYGPLWLRPSRWRASLALARCRNAPFYICEPLFRTRTKIRPMLRLAGIPTSHCQFIEDQPMHENEHWLDWLGRFSETTPPAFRGRLESVPCPSIGAPSLRTTAGERNDRDAWLRKEKLLGRKLVLLQPSNKRTMRWNGVRASEDDDKSWPAERWLTTATAISRTLPDACVLLCGAPSEAPYLRQILKAFGNGAGGVRLALLPLGRLKALLEIAHSMISVDTGPAHLAAALGCPLVVLFGGRSPLMWAPRSGRGSEVSVIGGLPDIRRMDQIEPKPVIKAWLNLRLALAATTEPKCAR